MGNALYTCGRSKHGIASTHACTAFLTLGIGDAHSGSMLRVPLGYANLFDVSFSGSC